MERWKRDTIVVALTIAGALAGKQIGENATKVMDQPAVVEELTEDVAIALFAGFGGLAGAKALSEPTSEK